MLILERRRAAAAPVLSGTVRVSTGESCPGAEFRGCRRKDWAWHPSVRPPHPCRLPTTRWTEAQQRKRAIRGPAVEPRGWVGSVIQSGRAKLA